MKNIALEENIQTKETFISLIIISDILVPDEITKRFGLQPTSAWAKGEEYVGNEWNQ